MYLDAPTDCLTCGADLAGPPSPDTRPAYRCLAPQHHAQRPAPVATDPGPRFFVVSETHGLVGVADTQGEAESRAFYAAVATARTVHVHDRLTELLG